MSLSVYISAALAFFLTTVLILSLRPIARRIGLVDVPTERKDHEGEIPTIGGLAIFSAVLLTHVIAQIFFPDSISLKGFDSFYTAGAILVIAGMVDDYSGLSPMSRIVIEIVAAMVMVYGAGVIVTDLGTMTLGSEVVLLGAVAAPFTIFATVAFINAVNMTDGLDGLAASLALIPLLGFIAAELLFGNSPDIVLLAILAAAIVAFLMFNVTVPGGRRALIFLGDSGSTFLGLVLAWFAIKLSQGKDSVITPAAALWFLTLPVYDIVCMTCRRIIRRRRPFSPDKEHLHHVFLLAGFTVTETVAIMAGLATLGVVVGLLGTLYQVPDLVLSASFLILGLLYFWVILRAWAVMRFLRRSICRRRSIGDRRTHGARRRSRQSLYKGTERRSLEDRRQEERRQVETK